MKLRILLTLAVCCASAHASAAEGWDRPLSIDLHAGTQAAPLGAFGGSAEWTPIRWIGLEVGGGSVFRGDYRVGAKVHARVVGQRHGLGVGVGVSSGPHTYDANVDRCRANDGLYFTGFRGCASIYDHGSARWPRVTFANTELAYEFRSAARFHLRAALGYSHPLSHAPSVCTDPPCSADDVPVGRRLYFDLTFGFALL